MQPLCLGPRAPRVSFPWPSQDRGGLDVVLISQGLCSSHQPQGAQLTRGLQPILLPHNPRPRNAGTELVWAVTQRGCSMIK